jgi:tRNA A37 threonylcarbamoyladenosine dehydratase
MVIFGQHNERIKMSIYNRQESLNLNSNITLTIVGVGGIGFWVATYAAMSGIEKMYIYDPDIIEEVNLNRLPIPDKFIGENKTIITKSFINGIRPECTIYNFPYKFTENTLVDTDYLIDCTDNHESQLLNQKIADSKGMKYIKAGYNGMSVSINNRVAEWGEAEDGYTIIPSWVVPASMVAAMTVAKIMKFNNKELSCNIGRMFIV